MRDTVRAGAADRPGVYRMMSPGGEVIYVGKSKRVRSRLLSYFRGAYPEHKGARILREADRIAWDYTPNEFDALVQELRLIKQYRPRFNVALKRDAHNYAFIKVTRGPAPKLSVVRSAGSDDGGAYYGPFLGAMRVGEALRELNDALGLRDCALDTPVRFSDQVEIFTPPPRTPGCIRHEIHKCLGPCIGACSEHQYAGRVALARAFFEGTNDGPLASLTTEMQQASDRLEYERAARLRDKLQRLENAPRAVRPAPVRGGDVVLSLHGVGLRRRGPRLCHPSRMRPRHLLDSAYPRRAGRAARPRDEHLR